MARRRPQPPSPRPPAPDPIEDEGEDLARWLGERLRRLALGGTAALVVARAYWPSEGFNEAETGQGLSWVLAVLVMLGAAIAAAWIDGRLRVRWSWADLAVIGLMLLVGLSASRGLERRVAINLAWEWGGLGCAYVLLRNLPRTPGEASALAGALTATAVAVSAYGLYQVGVEWPELQARFRADPMRVLGPLGIAPGSPQHKHIEDRLLGSNEPMATFALANSLAGFLVGPAVLALGVAAANLRREGRGARAVALALAALPFLVLLACLLLTKSRSAYAGLGVGAVVLAWRARRGVSARALVLAGVGLAVAVGLLVAAGVATGRLDRQVLTESTKSLRYRSEYWRGALAAVRETPRAFWWGFGPGNFAGPYLRHKLPQSSEEIQDPHNLFLDAWATAGLPAALVLAAALGLGLYETLGPARPGDAEASPAHPEPPDPRDEGAPPRRSGWLVACAGLGWLVVAALGALNPFEDELLARWLVLGGAWLWAVVLGMPLWRRGPVPGAAAGAGVLAVAVNLLAAGGLGIPAVALGLWSLLALGLDLRDDRPCGRLRDLGGRFGAFGAAGVWAALLGTFLGAVGPHWSAQRAMDQARDALQRTPPDFIAARQAYLRAIAADRYAAEPWVGLSDLEYAAWVARGAKADDEMWNASLLALEKALVTPRNPFSRRIQLLRAARAEQVLARLGPEALPTDQIRLRGLAIEATRKATHAYPNSAADHARLALANAAMTELVPVIGPEVPFTRDAQAEAREALRLDRLTPHADKKLPEPLRRRLDALLAEPAPDRPEAPAPQGPPAGNPSPRNDGDPPLRMGGRVEAKQSPR